MADVQSPGSESTRVGDRSWGTLLAEDDLANIERDCPHGLTSRQIVDLLTSRGIRFSEATLRKYVQLGLLPRSVRVGCKGKHQGSRGVYPANIIRRVNQVRAMMDANLTIEEIQKSFVRFKEDILRVETGLRDLLDGFEREAKEPALGAARRASIEAEIVAAKQAANDLVRRIAGVEASLSTRGGTSATGTAVGGGSDLF
jgi:DNA-binding transcriptional MerR regulator